MRTARAAEGTMGTIVIAGLRELGVHGVLPEEQTRPQPFEIDVELHVDLTTASETDRRKMEEMLLTAGTRSAKLF